MKPVRVGRPRGEDTENANLRRKQLIDAAVASIVEHGLSSTTLATVARASGLSQSTAVFYFKTKDALLSEAFRHWMQEYRNTWMDAAAAAGDDPVDRILAVAFASLDPKLISDTDLALWNSFWPEASRSESLQSICDQFEDERYKTMNTLFEQAGGELCGSAWTAKTAAQATETLLEGVWVQLYYSAAQLSYGEAVEIVGRLLSTIFPGRSDAIMKQARALVRKSQGRKK